LLEFHLIFPQKKDMEISAKPEGERVRKVSPDTQNKKIEEEIVRNIANWSAKTPDEISERIKKLDKEWDIERVLEINMATLSLIGLSLTVFVSPWWLLLPTVVLLFFVQHALMGWCPPIPVFRAFKVRTRPEIDREKYALKALRGDFNGWLENAGTDPCYRARIALQAVKIV
jgi:hypothetical protein